MHNRIGKSVSTIQTRRQKSLRWQITCCGSSITRSREIGNYEQHRPGDYRGDEGQSVKITPFGIIVVLCVSLPSTPVAAQKTVGYGTTSCKSWTMERRSESTASVAYSSWMLGFVSGINALGILETDESRNFLKTTVAKGIIAWVDGFCAQHPEDNLDSAGFALVGALKQSGQ
jgi:hypothetical protein